jgi:DNA-binding response OmpR family regulator
MAGKILIVDDEAFIRLLIEEALEDLQQTQGFDIFTASDGEEGFSIIRAEIPDLVFLDVMMPKMNGFDVCRKVRSELRGESIFLVMLTAKGQEEDRLLGESVGVDHFMTKPFDPDEIVEIAGQVLRAKHA